MHPPKLNLRTVQDHIQRIRRVGKAKAPWLVAAGLLPFVVLVSGAICYENKPIPPALLGILLLSLGPIVGLLIVTVRNQLSRQLSCPVCQRMFRNEMDWARLVATRRCPDCLAVIVGKDGEPAEPVPPDAKHSTEEQRQRERLQNWLFLQWPTALPAVLWILAAKPVVEAWMPDLRIILGDYLSPFVLPAVAAPGVFLGGVGVDSSMASPRSGRREMPTLPRVPESQFGRVHGMLW